MRRPDFSNATLSFDLDGTLVDTAPDLIRALNHVLKQRGYSPVQPETVRSSIAFGARAMIEASLPWATSTEDIDRMAVEFISHYENNIAIESRPYPGAIASLEALASAGARLALCTNKRERLTLKLLDALGIRHYFTAIAGRDTFSIAKPDPRHLTQLIAMAGGDPTCTVMVGDGEVDILTAKAAKIPVVLVSFGYGPHPVQGFAPDAIIHTFGELVGEAGRLLKLAKR